MSAKVGNAACFSAAQEVLSQIANAAFDFAFGLRAIGTTRSGRETPILCKVHNLRIPFGFAALVGSQNDGLHAVVENLSGNAAQLPKCRLVQPQQSRGLCVGGDVSKQGTAMPQCERKAIQRATAFRRLNVSEFSPIQLCLMSWWCLEAPHGSAACLVAKRTQVVFEDRIAARVAATSQFLQKHDCIPNPCRKSLLHIGCERIQLAAALGAGHVLRHGCPVAFEIFANRLAVKAAHAADLADAQPLPFEFL